MLNMKAAETRSGLAELAVPVVAQKLALGGSYGGGGSAQALHVMILKEDSEGKQTPKGE